MYQFDTLFEYFLLSKTKKVFFYVALYSLKHHKNKQIWKRMIVTVFFGIIL